MAINLSSPPALAGNADEQLQRMRSYVFRIVEDLNIGLRDMNAQGILMEIDRALSSNADAEENRELLSAHNNIRSLIIKTADFAMSNSEEFKKTLRSEYAAISDFGEIAEKLENEITANSEGLTQLFRYTSGIRSEFGDFSTTSEQYIKTGLLYLDDSGAPVYGVGVGNLSTKIDVNGQTVLDRRNLLTTTTADEIAFWNNGSKIAYINGSMMYFPSGKLKALNADISGKITATSGTIGGCQINNGVLKIGNANITSLDASKITTGFISIRNMKFDGIMDILGRDSTGEAYSTKGIFGYELESFLNKYKGLLLESNDHKRSMLLYPSRTWLMDESNGNTKLLYFRTSFIDLTYDEDYSAKETGAVAQLTLDSGYAGMSYFNRDTMARSSYIEIYDDDIILRFNGKRYYMSDIVSSCGL
ncbi:hypothetical protein IMSAG049_00415 [Clostridiales bacterium]|nr:hypothetical protein IMSAG049_00415 [Clostridiales bacterium]